MTPCHLLKTLWEAGAERVWVDDNGQIRVLWPEKAPSSIRGPFLDGRTALAEWLIAQREKGVRYIWSTFLRDLIAIAKTERNAIHVPSGIVCYIGIEVREIEGLDGTENLRLIHEAKKIFGGRVKRHELAEAAAV